MQVGSKSKRLFALALTAVFAVCGLVMGTLYAQGYWDESRAVHIDAARIENSTLAIGSHLIHLTALNDSIYEIAQKSAEESGQGQIYYKSELGGGGWFDITSATSLADITVSGSPVTDEQMEQLFFTHHTKSDHITYDLRTGQAVNIYDIEDPYDLESLEELAPLKNYYDLLREMDDDNKAIAAIRFLIWEANVDSPPPRDEFSTADVQDLKTRSEYEGQMSALQRYKKVLSDNDAGAQEIEKVDVVIGAVDAGRRYLVYANLDSSLAKYLDALQKEAKEKAEEGDEDDDEDDEPIDTELISAVAESLGNVQSAMITHGGKMLSEGVTVISAAQFDFSNSLIANAKANNHGACDSDVSNLLLLDNIQNNVISNRPAELELLETRLIAEATREYLSELSQGESGEYRAQLAKNSARALLNSLINAHGGDVNTRRGELEFLIEAKCTRMDTKSAQDFINERLDLTTGSFSAAIPADDFQQICLESVQAHIEYLTQNYRELELALGGNEMDKLVAEKEDLQQQRLSALDKGDLAKAKALQDEIDAVEESIRAIEEEAAAQIAQLQEKIDSLEDGSPEKAAAQAELENLQNSMSDGTLGSMVAQMKKDAMDSIRDGDDAGVENAVNGLSGLLGVSPELVLPAMQDIYNELLLNDGNEELIDAIEQAILENPNALKDDLSAAVLRQAVNDFLADNNATSSGTGASGAGSSGSGTGSGGTGTGSGGTGTGSDGTGTGGTGQAGGTGANGIGGTGGDTTGADGMDALLGLGGISFRNARYSVSAMIALHLYYEETGNRAAQQVMASLAQEQVNLGNPLVYERINDSAGEYIPLRSVQVLTGRRYVWEKNSSLGVLAYGADYYGFRVYSNAVLRDRDGAKTEYMARNAKYQNDVHVPEEYIYDQFGLQAVYLSEMTLGCTCDDAMLEQAQELLALLLSV